MSAAKSRGAAASVAVALLIGILAGCGSAKHDYQNKPRTGQQAAVQPSAARQTLVDEAASVVRQYWRARNLAYGALEHGPLTGYEDQAAALLSRGDIDTRRANGIPGRLHDLHAERPAHLPHPAGSVSAPAAGRRDHRRR